MCQVRPRAILDLRELRLAKAAANFALHRGGQLLLRHRTAQAAERTLYSATGAEFVAKFHGRTPYCNLQIRYYITLFCQAKSTPVSWFLYLGENTKFAGLLGGLARNFKPVI